MARADDRLTPAGPKGLVAAPAFALGFQGRERPHNTEARRRVGEASPRRFGRDLITIIIRMLCN